jgi:hypothetical protein
MVFFIFWMDFFGGGWMGNGLDRVRVLSGFSVVSNVCGVIFWHEG